MKPETWNPKRAESFKSSDTVAAYQFRAPYPEQTFEILADLVTGGSRSVLDVGTGTGEIARNLVELTDRIDAVDFSLPMIEAGKKKPNGNHPNLNWIHGKVEESPLNPPYSLITCGMSLHWLDWDIVIPRFAEMLEPEGFLAVVSVKFEDFPWSDELRKLRIKYRGYETAKPPIVVDELEKRRLFSVHGVRKTPEVLHSNTLDAYIEQMHSRSDMARVQIGDKAARNFDDESRMLIAKYTKERTITVRYYVQIVWGRPECLP